MLSADVICFVKKMATNADQETRLNSVARAILQGLYDVESPLHVLLGMHYILKAIWNNVVNYWKSRIRGSAESPRFDVDDLGYVPLSKSMTYVTSDCLGSWRVQFPKPSDININMMPFVMGSQFEETKLPENVRPYWDQMLGECIVPEELGKIGYLTIHESFVDEGSSQRRPGIHTESPGVLMLKGATGKATPDGATRRLLYWGRGNILGTYTLELHGGIYMASNVENSCRVWNCQILRPNDNCPDIVGNHGDIEHLREFLPQSSEVMAANKVYWLTDRTPHESLPLKKGTYRQFLRLVTSLVSVWYEDHSTKNPNGVVPDAKITKILKGNKFEGNCYEVEPDEV